ncbi:uncharacterized protein LOC132257196 [Phlebotomus argentipes]|uniref:uncharacterized protein LOC132257196 n=1 Tax=Phlebotomus argentipes TaxID=94469 RepID=UPI0028936D55|nr:uncharacterized protein LOC132257196 [Phlebotomus argentipes]
MLSCQVRARMSEHERVFIPSGMFTFKLGDSFGSYSELEERLEAHSKESFVTYWRRDTRTVKGAHRKTSRPISSNLIYYSLRLACVFGGQKFSPRGQGKRSCQTLRSDCPAYITLRASKCGQKLEVISVCNAHNHELSERLNKSLPQNRKLPPDMKEEVLLLLTTDVTRVFVIEYIRLKTGKELTKKDLFNMAATSRRKDDKRVNSQARVADAMNNMKAFLLKHSPMYQRMQEEALRSKATQDFEDSEDSITCVDPEREESIVVSSAESEIDMEQQYEFPSGQLIGSENSSILEIMRETPQTGQYVEYIVESPEQVYRDETPANTDIIQLAPEKARRRKRWKSSSYCRCRCSSLKLLELKMKFLRMKCRKMRLVVQELEMRKRQLSRENQQFLLQV